jgi:transcriptional regulator with XRE-family HTH domain
MNPVARALFHLGVFVLYLELARRNKKWSQDTLGAFARVAKDFVSAMETGKAWPTPDQRERIAQVLGVPADTLMDEVQVKTVEESQQAAR